MTAERTICHDCSNPATVTLKTHLMSDATDVHDYCEPHAATHEADAWSYRTDARGILGVSRITDAERARWMRQEFFV